MVGRAMIARGNPAKVDEVVDLVRNRIVPDVRACHGNLGLSLWADSDTGLVIVNTAWTDGDALMASRPTLHASRDALIATLEAPDARIETMESILFRQQAADQVGYWSRATEFEVPLEQMAEAQAAFAEQVLPELVQMPGANTVALLADAASGRHIAAITFSSREAMEAAREPGRHLREAFFAGTDRALRGVMEAEVRIVGMGGPTLGAEVPAQERAADRQQATTR